MIRFVLVSAVLLLSGCASFYESFRMVDSSVLSREHQAHPLSVEQVGVFLASDVIPAECKRVALLRAAPAVAVVDSLRAEAGRLGANAVDLRDFRTGDPSRPDQADVYWDAVALYCPSGNG